DILRRRAVADRVQARVAVGVIEAPALEQPRRAGMLRGGARPEHAHLLVDLLVADAGVVGGAARRGAPQLLEDRARRLEVEVLSFAQTLRQAADDLPVAARLGRRRDGLAD